MKQEDWTACMRRILGVKKTIEKTDLSRSTIYRLEKAGLFPKRRQISPGRIGWLEQEIDDFIAARQLGGLHKAEGA